MKKTLNQLNLSFTKVLKLSLWVFITVLLAKCKKDTILQPEPPALVVDTTKPRIRFVFVNRSGYKNDSTALKWFQSVNLHVRYYNPKTNITTLSQTAFNRNFYFFGLRDSINYLAHESLVGVDYAFEIRIFWFSSLGTQFGREIKFTTFNWPYSAETVTIPKDTTIKFIYPQDTLPNNKFVRVF